MFFVFHFYDFLMCVILDLKIDMCVILDVKIEMYVIVDIKIVMYIFTCKN